MCYFQLIQCVKYYLTITAIISLIIVYFIRKRILTANMSLYNADELSDDEVYFGKLTLKELKKHILWDKQQQQQTMHPTSAISSPKNSGDHNESLKILQAHSQPNLIPKTENSKLVLSELNSPGWDMKAADDSFMQMENMVAKLCVSPRNNDNSKLVLSELNSPGWDMKAADDSFIQMENMVAKLCVSPRNNEKTEELNNTLEVIEYILNNPPSNTKEKSEKDDDLRLMTEFKYEPNVSDLSSQKIDRELKKYEAYKSPEPPQTIPVKTTYQLHKYTEGHTTPRDIKQKPIFKTPAQPISLKKPSSVKKTPSRSNAYQHISSPVASYIKNCPIAPLVKDVHPKKPLPGTSSIPKFVKNLPPAKPSNKENVNLPSVAYKSAKKTRVIDVPDEQKLPQSHWVKKTTTTLPRPLVMKHDHRELNFAKKKLMPQQEDSFADLSYHQAEVSVCTQKSAIKIKKNL